MQSRKQQGTLTVEFAMGSFAFVILFLAWAEISYLGFVSSVVDYAASESSRFSRTQFADDTLNDNGDITALGYQQAFTGFLRAQDAVWTKFVNPDAFQTQFVAFTNIEALKNCQSLNACSNGGSLQKPLAVYQLTYDYTPVFSGLYDNSNISLTREVITIQEYER